MAGVRHVDDVFAVEGVNGLSESCAGFLGVQAVFVAAMALWRFLDGWHEDTCFHLLVCTTC